MKTKQFFSILLLWVVATTSPAQSWQWGKSGGSSSTNGSNGSGTEALDEKIINMVADTNGNIYTCSNVYGNDLIINGVPKTTNNTPSFGYDCRDGLIMSYDCNGNLRWQQTLGGCFDDKIKQIGIDNQNNIYVLAEFLYRGYETCAQTHLSSTVVLPDSPALVNLNKERVYLIKYNNEGVVQWYKSPQPSNLPSANTLTNGGMAAFDLQVDPQGNCYLLCNLGYGPYCNGAYVTPTTPVPKNHILQYDAAGNFVTGHLLDYDSVTNYGFEVGKFKRNHNNGKFYIIGYVAGFDGYLDNDTVTIGGQSYTYLDFQRCVAAFNADGTFSWLAHNGPKAVSNFANDIAFDADNNVYFAAGLYQSHWDGTANPPNIIDSWNGVPFEVSPDNPLQGIQGFSALVKMDPNGNTLWQTNSYTSYSDLYVYDGGEDCIKVAGDEIILPYGNSSLKWQNITNNNPVPISSSGNARGSIKRFNKNTGQIIAAHFLDAITNSYNSFRAASVDSKGNIYCGGSFNVSVVVNGVTLNSNGGPNDFLIAKFGSSNCNFLDTATQEMEQTDVYPNPVTTFLNINNPAQINYELYSSLGAKVQEGIIEAMGKINMEQLPKGMYMLQTKNKAGFVKIDKIIKN